MYAVLLPPVLLLALIGATCAVPTDVTRSLTTNTVEVGAKTPCDTPEQWEGRSSEWDHISESNDRYTMTFDGKNRRKRFMEEVKSYMPGHRYVEYWQFFDTKLEYQYDHTYKKCVKIPLTTWRNHTIPRDAILEDTYDVGAPGKAIVANEWSDRVTGRQKEAWIGVFTTQKDGCWPMFEVYSEDEPEKEISWSTRFFNLTAGIKDPKVFDLPEECKSIPLTTPSTLTEVNPTTEAPGFFTKFKSWARSWLMGTDKQNSNNMIKKVKTWGGNKAMNQMNQMI